MSVRPAKGPKEGQNLSALFGGWGETASPKKKGNPFLLRSPYLVDLAELKRGYSID